MQRTMVPWYVAPPVATSPRSCGSRNLWTSKTDLPRWRTWTVTPYKASGCLTRCSALRVSISILIA